MTKLYYTDAIKAAYMAKEFGAKFLLDNGFEVGFSYIIMDAAEGDAESYYIYPDSVDFFEPREGDRIKDNKGTLRFICKVDEYGQAYWVDEDGYKTCPHKDMQIIIRDNKQFFEPERE